jgi:dTDP-4-amino-4,6-dideoxygalactose transaminase
MPEVVDSYLGLSRPAIGEEEIEELLDAIRSGWVTTGPKVETLQERLQSYLGVPFVRCLSSCTAGLALGLRLLGVGPGDEVILPTLTFVSCANVVEHAGATPVLADIDPDTGLIDLEHAETIVSARTRALMPVHLGGRPLDMGGVTGFAERHGVGVVEDAAHAIGAAWRGRRIGAHGHLAAFSFHATKNMTTFEGGALALYDEEAAERVRRLSLHGLSRSAWSRHGARGPDAYEVTEPGFKLAMHDVSAAVGIHQLARLDGWIDRREELAAAYDNALAGLPLDLPPAVPWHARHARHLYPVRLHDDAPVARDAVIAGLQERGIGSSVHFRPVHEYAYYARRSGLRPEDLPVAAAFSRRVFSLPLFPAMRASDVERVATALWELIG